MDLRKDEPDVRPDAGSGVAMILAPLRGVTIRCFREVFAEPIREAGFTEAITPFIAAMPGLDPLKDRELRADESLRPPVAGLQPSPARIRITPQFIGKDPAALRACLERLKSAGFATADLNCGCPFPMVRNKGRGSGLLKTPDVLRKMIETGCSVMGEGKFSIKARLGVDRKDELLGLMPMINEFPLRFLTVHARTARQMYEGDVDRAAFGRIAAVCKVPLVYNGDVPVPRPPDAIGAHALMVGRGFIRHLGEREDIGRLLDRYVEASVAELHGERPVLGRLKELLAYWKDIPAWRRRWQIARLARNLDELRIW